MDDDLPVADAVLVAAPTGDPIMDNLLYQWRRFGDALAVCSLVLHRDSPPDSWEHAAQEAASAPFTDWTIDRVDEDDPLLRRRAEEMANQA